VISKLKKLLAASKNSANPLVRRSAKSIYFLVKVKNFWIDEEYRQQSLLRLRYPFKLQQLTTYTAMNRYPRIFSACRNYFGGGDKELKILSYGCSTGEEVLTLRRYFPNAFIVGAEINPQALAKCRELEVDNRIAFVRSDTKIIKSLAPFDAVFCMAVLQRTPHKVINENIANLKRIYSFSKFETQIEFVDACLKNEGLLVIHHTQYLLAETSAGSRYESLEDARREVKLVRRFNKNGNRIEHLLPEQSIFIKKKT
jgi:2-polyprenyl-3-methyl-5-hydroxy-6-metoxy-1,4-benzoquinol methylase